jgi:hypothetical protein
VQVVLEFHHLSNTRTFLLYPYLSPIPVPYTKKNFRTPVRYFNASESIGKQIPVSCLPLHCWYINDVIKKLPVPGNCLDEFYFYLANASAELADQALCGKKNRNFSR